VGAIGELTQIADFRPQLPMVVLIDVPFVETELANNLRTAMPDCGLLFLVESYELNDIVNSLRAGATGFIAHDSAVGDLARAIIATGRGEIVLPQEIATQALIALARGEVVQTGPSVTLTGREQEVLDLLARGHTNKNIAQALFLSVRTVEAHLRNIYGKLGVTSRTEAALWAVNHDHTLSGRTAANR
jgi:DNA-binding NarL/FixJ family response regulator